AARRRAGDLPIPRAMGLPTVGAPEGEPLGSGSGGFLEARRVGACGGTHILRTPLAGLRPECRVRAPSAPAGRLGDCAAPLTPPEARDGIQGPRGERVEATGEDVVLDHHTPPTPVGV